MALPFVVRKDAPKEVSEFVPSYCNHFELQSTGSLDDILLCTHEIIQLEYNVAVRVYRHLYLVWGGFFGIHHLTVECRTKHGKGLFTVVATDDRVNGALEFLTQSGHNRHARFPV